MTDKTSTTSASPSTTASSTPETADEIAAAICRATGAAPSWGRTADFTAWTCSHRVRGRNGEGETELTFAGPDAASALGQLRAALAADLRSRADQLDPRVPPTAAQLRAMADKLDPPAAAPVAVAAPATTAATAPKAS